MLDLFFAAVLAGFCLLSWGLVELCSRLMGGER
jgi:hypothetical protein